ncbi:MAG: choice-of-anchor tandem repeat GloVer-containing protein [Pseudomonadota bacterium]
MSLAALLLGIAATPRLIAAPQGANLLTLAILGTITDSGTNVRGDMLLASDGNFYLASYGGGTAGGGAILQMTPAGTVTNIHSLAGAPNEGLTPYGGLIEGVDGDLYGTTYLGGAHSVGTVFKVTKAGAYTNLYSFDNASKGAFLPYTGLVQAPDGNLYGTTLRGGSNDLGTVYKVTTTGTFSVLHNFDGNSGKSPEGKLVVGADGALYGTTLLGGANDRGVVYKITTAGTITTLYSFAPLGAFNDRGVATNADGANPRAGLLLGADGNFYGTSYQGGTQGWGTVFRMTPAGAISTLHSFAGAPTGGANPLAGVTQGADGSLYGTTEKGGPASQGIAWQIAPDGTFHLLHGFTGITTDGSTPYSTLVPLSGALYGVTYSDSVSGTGTIYKLDLGTGGVLPLVFSITPESIALGASATLAYSSPTAATCLASAAWTDTITNTGTKVLTPTTPGIYSYVLTCTDAASVTRNAYASLVVNAPAAEPVDGGGDGGGGALSLLALALLGCTTIFAKLTRKQSDHE